MRTEHLTVEVDDTTMPLFLAEPEPDARRGSGIVVLMEAFGVNDHIRDVTQRLAEQGHTAVAPDLYHRQGQGLTGPYEDPSAIIDAFAGLRTSEIEADVAAALDVLRSRPGVAGDRLGAIGFCLGGYAALLTAARLPVAAAASFYGAGAAIPRGGPLEPVADEAEGSTARVMCFYGDQDPHVPPEEVAAVRAALERAPGHHEVVVYEGAEHGFFCDQRGSYHPDAARDAWARTTRLFEEL